jgi:glutamyl-Q tRNA(Asp) synthetase
MGGRYRGRFAPSPTGPLHLGSLIAAVGSYLDAKFHQGLWFLRIEDIDTPRVVKGASESIVNTLAVLGMRPDGPVSYQSSRILAYHAALHKLRSLGLVYPCVCSRKELADSHIGVSAGKVYPGKCRNGFSQGKTPRSLRVRTDSHAIEFYDAVHGKHSYCLESEVGDFVLYRNRLYAYQLAVVVDDAEQAITHVVRGADLIDSTPRQIYLQSLLGFSVPSYLHLPVAVNAAGEKLSKQTLAVPVDAHNPATILCLALKFLNQDLPAHLAQGSVDTIWKWAIPHWNRDALPRSKYKEATVVE